MLIETHAHLDYPDFTNDLDDVLRRAVDAGVTRVITIGTSIESSRRAIDLAVELGLNVVIHQRDAWDETLRIIQPYAGKLRGVFHCFGGSLDQANEVLGLDHLVSFTGIVTFKNGAAVREVAAEIPLWKFMVETDCPYLAPVPFRGKRAEPAHTRIVAEAIATARGVPLEEIAEATTETADGFFRFNRA